MHSSGSCIRLPRILFRTKTHIANRKGIYEWQHTTVSISRPCPLLKGATLHKVILASSRGIPHLMTSLPLCLNYGYFWSPSPSELPAELIEASVATALQFYISICPILLPLLPHRCCCEHFPINLLHTNLSFWKSVSLGSEPATPCYFKSFVGWLEHEENGGTKTTLKL